MRLSVSRSFEHEAFQPIYIKQNTCHIIMSPSCTIVVLTFDNFCQHWHLWAFFWKIFGNFWQLLTPIGNFLQLLASCGNFLQSFGNFGIFWHILSTFGCVCQLLTIFHNFCLQIFGNFVCKYLTTLTWRCLAIFSNPKAIFGNVWQLSCYHVTMWSYHLVIFSFKCHLVILSSYHLVICQSGSL